LVCCLHIVDIPASAGKEAEILLSLRTGCPTACTLIATSSALSNKTTSTSGDRRPHGQRQNRDRSHPRDHGQSHPRHHGRSHPEATAKTAGEAVAKATVKMMESLHDDDRRREAEEPRRTFPIGKEVGIEVVGRLLVAIGVG
jgi:hypothetical protein